MKTAASRWGRDAISQTVSLVGFLFFVAYTWWAAQRVPKDDS